MTQLGKGRAAAITAAEMAALADELGCHPADLEAIAEVESSGFGWFKDGRIKILFEKHWFYKLVSSQKRPQAVSSGLARRSWISPSKGGYRDQRSADQRYRLLDAAIDIDRAAALQSISIGRFQIMGFNYRICGFGTVEEMWAAFLDSEANQLRAFGNFLKSKRLVAALRKRDFAAVEKGYNGGGLGGTYARRMKAASDKLRAGKWKHYKPGSMSIEKQHERRTSANETSAPTPTQSESDVPQVKPTSEAPRPVAEANGLNPVVAAALALLGAMARALFGIRLRPNWAPDEDRAGDEGPLPSAS